MEKESIKNMIDDLKKAGENLNYKPQGLLSLLTILFDYLLIFLMAYITLKTQSNFLYFLSLIIIASRMRGLENLLHEASHNNLFVNKKLNIWVGRLFCAFPIGNSFDAYRASHFDHHRYFGDSERDPDLKHYQALKIDKLPLDKKALIIFFLSLFSPIKLVQYISTSISKFVYNKSVSKNENLMRLLFFTILLGVIHAFSLWKIFLLFWVIPLLTSFQWIKSFAELTEHGGLYHKPFLEKTRNNLYAPWINFIFYPHNDNYHLLHHIFPFCSFHHARVLHKKLMKCSADYASLNHCQRIIFETKETKAILPQLMVINDAS